MKPLYNAAFSERGLKVASVRDQDLILGLRLPVGGVSCPAWAESVRRSDCYWASHLVGGLDPIHHAADLAEMAAEQQAVALLLPISARRQLNELSDEFDVRLIIL
ncbi:hypothetical protein [Deinococcus rubellus]|uniref:hypothetical protein n=1 Tax=Deinococcus rubellus TaxID=1889240 RepID=UPI0031E5A93A